jgi:preprotein translocase subunit SecG
MQTVLLIIHLIIALALVGAVLLQRSEGGALGIGGGPGGVMSARGAANFLTRTTAILAAVFFVTSILLTILAQGDTSRRSIMDVPVRSESQTPQAPQAPQEPAVPSVPLSE